MLILCVGVLFSLSQKRSYTCQAAYMLIKFHESREFVDLVVPCQYGSHSGTTCTSGIVMTYRHRLIGYNL